MVSEKTRRKMSISAKSRCTKEWCKKKSDAYRTVIDDDLLRHLYFDKNLTQLECANAMGIGRKVVSNAFKRLGLKARVATKRDQWGDNNTGWKGSFASYSNKHRRVYRAFGQPKKCDVCGTSDSDKTYDWASLSGEYDNLSDYKRMCRSCHRKYDCSVGKLTKNQVLSIKRLLNDGVSQKEIARLYNVQPSTISKIKTGKTWSHI